MATAGMLGIGISELAIILMMLGGGFGAPLGVPPLPEDAGLAAAAPPECVFYLSSAGMASPDAGSTNRLEQLMAEPEVQRLMQTIYAQFATASQQMQAAEAGEFVAEMPGLLQLVLSKPMALYVADVQRGEQSLDVQAALVLNAGDEAANLKRSLGRILRAALRQADAQPVEVRIGGLKFQKLPTPPGTPEVVLGFRDTYLIVATGEAEAEAIVERMAKEAARPAWLDDVHERLPVARPALVSYINVARGLEIAESVLPEPLPTNILSALGVDQLQAIASVSGLDETEYVSQVLLQTDGAPGGLFALMNQAPLSLDALRGIPADANVALVWKADLAQILAQVQDLATAADEQAGASMRAGLAEMEDELGLDIEDDLLGPLGDTWRVFNAPSTGGALFTGWTIVADLDDAEALRGSLDDLANRLATQAGGPSLLRRFEHDGVEITLLQIPAPIPLAPTWCVTDDQLVVGLYPQSVKAYLSQRESSTSLADRPELALLFEGSNAPSSIVWQDTRDIVERMYPILEMMTPVVTGQMAQQGLALDASILPSLTAIAPHLGPSVSASWQTADGLLYTSRQSLPGSGNMTAVAPVGVALLLPAVQSAREAARRAQAANNLKQIGLSMHNHYDVFREFPTPAIVDSNGDPLLSWRVKVLPFVEQAPLYEQFSMDEAWDSPANSQWSATIVPVYLSPNDPNPQLGLTPYQFPFGEGTMFPAYDEALGFPRIIDGTSNTIMTLEVAQDRAVEWSRPADFTPNEDDLLDGLRGARPGGFQTGFADGSVRFISDSIDPEVLRALLTPDGGEVVPYEGY